MPKVKIKAKKKKKKEKEKERKHSAVLIISFKAGVLNSFSPGAMSAFYFGLGN